MSEEHRSDLRVTAVLYGLLALMNVQIATTLEAGLRLGLHIALVLVWSINGVLCWQRSKRV